MSLVDPLPSPHETPSQPVALRLFSDADGVEQTAHGPLPTANSSRLKPPPDCWPGMTLGELHAGPFRRRERRFSAADTLKEDAATLGYWREFSQDPPLDAITKEDLEEFRDWLLEQPGRRGAMRASTVKKHLELIERLLKFAAKQTLPQSAASRRRGDEPTKLLSTPPDSPKLKVPRAEPHGIFTLEEIAKFLAAARMATAPRFLRPTPALFWESLITVSYNTGCRISDALLLRFSHIGPGETCGVWAVIPRSRQGWQATKGESSRRLVINRFAQAAIDAMRPGATAGDDRVFACDYSEGYFNRKRIRLLARGGIPPARQFGMHGVRKRANTEMRKLNSAAAEQFLGHKGSINLDHYTADELLWESAQRLPQPPRLELDGVRQLEMF